MIDHSVSRVVGRRFAFGKEDKEQLRTYMRMYENFSGCRVLAYCFMCNHLHLLLEVPPIAAGGLSEGELLQRPGCIHEPRLVQEDCGAARRRRAGRCGV